MMSHAAEFTLPMKYSFCGQFVTDEDWLHPTRVIDTYEVLMVMHGEVHLIEDGIPRDLFAGDLILLRPGIEHGGSQVSHGRTSFFWAHFYADSLDALSLTPGSHTLEEPDRLTSAFRWLLHVSNTPDYPAYGVDAAMSSLLAEISASQARSGAGASRLAHEIAEWVRINSDRKLTVHLVAEHFTYHPDYLCALMKTTFGKGLKEYISEERMKRIKTLLLTTDRSVKELAAQLSFGSAEQLIHYFKYHESISPTRFRNQYVSTHLNRQ